MQYRMATKADIELLVTLRLAFIHIQEDDERYGELKKNCDTYFNKAYADNTCDVVLTEENGNCIATGIVFYYDSVPSPFNTTGKNAYITSMYVEPGYRRQGIGTEILNRVIECAKNRGVTAMFLSASEMGRPLYEKRGFTDSKNGMMLELKSEI